MRLNSSNISHFTKNKHAITFFHIVPSLRSQRMSQLMLDVTWWNEHTWISVYHWMSECLCGGWWILISNTMDIQFYCFFRFLSLCLHLCMCHYFVSVFTLCKIGETSDVKAFVSVSGDKIKRNEDERSYFLRFFLSLFLSPLFANWIYISKSHLIFAHKAISCQTIKLQLVHRAHSSICISKHFRFCLRCVCAKIKIE